MQGYRRIGVGETLLERNVCQQEVLRRIDGRAIARIAAGAHTEHCIDHESRPFREQSELPRCVAGGPEIEMPLGTVGVEDNASLVIDRRLGIEGLPRLQMAHHEICRESAQREPAARTEGASELADHRELVVAAPKEAEADRKSVGEGKGLE